MTTTRADSASPLHERSATAQRKIARVAIEVALLLLVVCSGCPSPAAETCVARVVVMLPSPSPIADEGDVARVVVTRGGVEVFAEVVDLFGSGQSGGDIEVLTPDDTQAPIVVAGRDLSLSLTVFSSISNEVVGSGRARFDCEVNDTVAVPLYLGPANGLAPAAAMPGARDGATLTPLADGRVLLFGGADDGEVARPAAALFDPVIGAWCTDCIDADDALARHEHTATALADGRVIIAGGVAGDALANDVLAFDPTDGSFVVIGAIARRAAGAARVSDDAVLVVGGFDAEDTPSASAFIVDADGVRPAIGSLSLARAWPAAASLPNGVVMVAGGEDESGPLDSLELFRADETFGGPLLACPTAPAGENLCARRSRAVAVVLDDGNVLVTGGIAISLDDQPPPDGDVFVVSDQRALAATATATGTSRDGAAVTRLACGAPPCPALIVGGADAPHALFHIAAGPPALGARDYGGAFVVGARDAVLAAHAGVAAASLVDGTALVVGGANVAGRAKDTAARFTLCEDTADLACPAP